MSNPSLLHRRALSAALIIVTLASSLLAGCASRASRTTPATQSSSASASITDQTDQIDALLGGLTARLDQTDTLPDVGN